MVSASVSLLDRIMGFCGFTIIFLYSIMRSSRNHLRRVNVLNECPSENVSRAVEALRTFTIILYLSISFYKCMFFSPAGRNFGQDYLK